MTKQELIDTLKNYKKGTYIHIEYKTTKQMAQKYGSPLLEKKSSGCYRLGLKFANLKENKNRVINERPWGVHVEYMENYLIEHNGKYYLQVYTTPHKTHTKYFLNGKETSKQELELNFNYKTSPKASVFNIALENVLKLGKA